VKAQGSLIEVGLTGEFSFWTGLRIVIARLRALITLASIVIITWFIFTIDPDAEETALDLVKDFTSLVIIVEIDEML